MDRDGDAVVNVRTVCETTGAIREMCCLCLWEHWRNGWLTCAKSFRDAN
jgi:hypothetical protein